MNAHTWLYIFCLGVAGGPGFAEEPSIAAGRQFAEQNCSRCHAIGTTGDSLHPPAPPFRTLHKHYDVEGLREALAEGIFVGHPEMPQFELAPDQIESLVRYLKSLEAAN